MMCDNCNRVYNTCQNQIRDLTKYQSVLPEFFTLEQQAEELAWVITQIRHFQTLGDLTMTKTRRCDGVCEFQALVLQERVVALCVHLDEVTRAMAPEVQSRFIALQIQYALEGIDAAARVA
jgi:hypothetical protein